MSLFITIVFGNVMEVVSADDESTVHFRRNNLPGEDTTTDRDITSEWALLVNVCPLDRL